MLNVALSTNAIFQILGIGLNIAGIAGQASSAGVVSAGSVISFLVLAGGGGGTGTGGGLSPGGPFPNIPNTPINTNGGNGAPGCGGGGGGAGTVSAGNGGNGGDGFVIITTNF